MLELRPTCENCDRALPPATPGVMICSFECTFCAACARDLENVCPNCGGGFCERPVRPAHNWKGDNYLGKYPPRSDPKHCPVDRTEHRALLDRVAGRAPAER